MESHTDYELESRRDITPNTCDWIVCYMTHNVLSDEFHSGTTEVLTFINIDPSFDFTKITAVALVGDLRTLWPTHNLSNSKFMFDGIELEDNHPLDSLRGLNLLILDPIDNMRVYAIDDISEASSEE
eukprot:3659605-Heterocapsa_arctica.AAC.1